MPMKAYACPRCLTLSSECEDGDGGPHECTPTPMVRDLESRVAELESAIREHAEVVRDTLHAGEDIDYRLWSILDPKPKVTPCQTIP